MRVKSVITTTGSFRKIVFAFDFYLHSFFRLIFRVGDSIECLVTEVDMRIACVTGVAKATMPVLFAPVARVVYCTRIRDPHDNASTFRTADVFSFVYTSDLKLLAAHSS